MSYLAIKSDDAQICHKDTNATTISLLEVQVPKVKGQKWEKKKNQEFLCYPHTQDF